MPIKSYSELQSAYADIEKIVQWILENPNIHPNNIHSQMKIYASKYNIPINRDDNHGCIVLNLGK